MSETDIGLSELPDGWVWTTVGSIGLVASGQTPKGINDLDLGGEIPFYKVSDMNKLGNEKFMRAAEIAIDDDQTAELGIHVREQGTVIFPKRGGAIATNKKRILSCPSAYDLNIMGVLPYIVPTDFFYQWLLSIDLAALSDGSNVPQLNHKDIDPLPFPLPPLPEQHRIVAKIEELFTKLDAGINELHKAQSQLKRYRQSVLKAAFEGKLTEVWRAEYQEEIEPTSPITGDLPNGWIWVTVEKIAQKIHYGYTESATNDPIGPKFLRITDIQNNSVNWDSVPYCQIDGVKQQQYLLKENDLVFARTGATVGKSFLIQGSIPDAVFASYLIRIILKEEINAKFVYTFFQSQSYWTQIHQGKVGSGQPNVNAKILSQITLPLPSPMEQQAIVSEVESRLSVADEVEKTVAAELKRAEQLRQSILKKAFSGKLVPQDPNDEPASALLERIKTQKEIVF